jgi:hypothetical protein
MNYDVDKLIGKYLNEKRNGKDFTDIRKELEELSVEESKIRFIIRSIDNVILKEETNKVANIKAREVITIGGILSAVGLFITIGTYSGLIYMGNSFLIAYGPLFTGIAILFVGLNMRKK